jgi:hypothetical protein
MRMKGMNYILNFPCEFFFITSRILLKSLGQSPTQRLVSLLEVWPDDGATKH